MGINDKVKVVKNNDKFNGRVGTIIEARNFIHTPVTLFKVKFEDGLTKEYFYCDIVKIH